MSLATAPSARRPASTGMQPVLGIFPSLDELGGVQISGRLAWEAISRLDGDARGESVVPSRLVCYGRRRSSAARSNGDGGHAETSIGAVLMALRVGTFMRTVLVWHVSLLRLLPFVRARSARVVLFLHGVEAWRAQDPLTGFLLQRVDRFLTNSSHTWQRFITANPGLSDATHAVVPLGLDEPLSRPTAAPDPTPALLMLGRLLRSEDYKGHREMISAWPLVLEEIPGAELWIAGDGDLREPLERMVVERGLEGHVRFWGEISEDTKALLLDRARGLAMPSRGEGFGLVYLEAMRRGRPCLVSTADAGREVTNPPAGLAVDPGDARAVAEAASRLLEAGREWEGWSAAARARYESFYTAAHFQSRLVSTLGAGVVVHG